MNWANILFGPCAPSSNKDSGRRNHLGGYTEVVAGWRVTRASQLYQHTPLLCQARDKDPIGRQYKRNMLECIVPIAENQLCNMS
jgi:hypothetical protein